MPRWGVDAALRAAIRYWAANHSTLSRGLISAPRGRSVEAVVLVGMTLGGGKVESDAWGAQAEWEQYSRYAIWFRVPAKKVMSAPPILPRELPRLWPLFAGMAVVAGLCAGYPYFISLFAPTLDDQAAVGSAFGAVSALFSGLAFVALIFAIVLQQAELRETRRELHRSATTQERALAATRHHIRADALAALIRSLAARLESGVDDGVRERLVSELEVWENELLVVLAETTELPALLDRALESAEFAQTSPSPIGPTAPA